ncbi:MAG: glutathione ABC transporter permease GsiC [Deltaproteobacteria bacterium]|nr:glutathione ABC transporter permease GsiC [Deltaproteobacteria bacterium]
MRTYIIRRVLLVIPTLFILSILVFLSVRFLPGDAIDAMLDKAGWIGATGVDRAALEKMLGLDVPAYVQYGRWLEGIVLHGTLGNSLWGGEAIEAKIIGRLPVTIELGALAIVIGLVIAIPVGVYSAIRQDTVADYAGRTVAVIGLATPNFWLGVMAMLYPVIWWGWSPRMELIPFSEDPLGNLGMFLVPSLILGTALAASTMRMTRTMMLEVLRQDYIRTAWAKGNNERLVVVRHAMKNAFIPVITLIGLQLPILVGGSVIIENIFNLPGLGRLMLDALADRDYPVVTGINLFFGTIVMGVNLLIDLLYSYLDPRIRY